MSGKNHNKRRNSGLLYEFLVRSISQSLVEGDKKRSNVSLRLVKRHFRPGTELHKEFRLINALVRTTVSSEAVAASIVQEAKRAARSHDLTALDREKSLLINNINRAVNDPDFFDQQVSEYRMYATVQTLLNDWRSPAGDLGRMAKYEDQLVQWLVSPKQADPDHAIDADGPGTGRLLMKVMMRKLNEKYAGALTEDQRALVRAYAFSTANSDPLSIRMKLEEIKRKLIVEIDGFSSGSGGDEYIGKKLVEARQRLEQERLDVVDDDTVTRFMLYAKLNDELTSEDA